MYLILKHIKSENVHQHLNNNDFQKIAVNAFETWHVIMPEIRRTENNAKKWKNVLFITIDFMNKIQKR